jgi:hypothetical protein
LQKLQALFLPRYIIFNGPQNIFAIIAFFSCNLKSMGVSYTRSLDNFYFILFYFILSLNINGGYHATSRGKAPA